MLPAQYLINGHPYVILYLIWCKGVKIGKKCSADRKTKKLIWKAGSYLVMSLIYFLSMQVENYNRKGTNIVLLLHEVNFSDHGAMYTLY